MKARKSMPGEEKRAKKKPQSLYSKRTTLDVVNTITAKSVSDSELYVHENHNDDDKGATATAGEPQSEDQATLDEFQEANGSNLLRPTSAEGEGQWSGLGRRKVKKQRSLYVVRKPPAAAPAVRKMSDSEVYLTRQDEDQEKSIYEFPKKAHETSEIITLVKNMKVRRNAICEDSPTKVYKVFVDYLRDKMIDEWF